MTALMASVGAMNPACGCGDTILGLLPSAAGNTSDQGFAGTTCTMR